MSREELQLALEKLKGLKAHVEGYFEHEEQNPGICWTLFPIGHAIDHAITEVDTYLQHQQQSQEHKAS